MRAWRRRETFEGRSTFRAWLYRIATNACLDLLARCRPEPAAGGEVLWLQPYPDGLLDELAVGEVEEPEAVAVARETIELAGPVVRRTPGRASWCAAIPTPAWPRTSTGSPHCCGTTSASRCRPRRACTSGATRW
ncbi:hypothetical protein OG417_40100 [Actinoallomurus sp. NBC_01490]|uniref:sigma factor n=1 Tax=Actinoallomurus sp. NBC_01490 TaxID=2903557 RepID=UPI002E2EECF3|nr:sigma factor [Actinoallomurus sp. NBC_01490]